MSISPTTPSTPTSPTGRRPYRLVILGSAAVGKTCIVSRFLHRDFVQGYKATVEEMHRGEYEVAGMPLTLDILDTSGSFPFPAMRRLSIANGDAFVLVYSVQDESSFEEVKALRQQIIEEKGEDAMTPIVIVGNKAEVAKEEREITKEIAESTAAIDWGHSYVEASAKNNINIDTILMELFLQAEIFDGNSCDEVKGKGKRVVKRRETYPPARRQTKRNISTLRNSDGCSIC